MRYDVFTHRILIIALAYFVCGVAQAEYYDLRPSILKTQAKNHEGTGLVPEGWNKAKHGHFVLLAQTLTFFPDSEYYFLARDVEYLYDMAKVLLKKNPDLKKRLHLVPVSRVSSTDTYNMVRFLRQEGVTKRKLHGRKPVFIDSCCTGSIPWLLYRTFKSDGIEARGFLMKADLFPESRVAKALGADGYEIEWLPHYTSPAIGHEKIGEKVRVRTAFNDQQTKAKALAIMEQIRFDFDNDRARAELTELMQWMRTAYAYLVRDSPYEAVSKKQALKALENMAIKYGISISHFIDDVKSMERRNYATVFEKRVEILQEFASAFPQKCMKALETVK